MQYTIYGLGSIILETNQKETTNTSSRMKLIEKGIKMKKIIIYGDLWSGSGRVYLNFRKNYKSYGKNLHGKIAGYKNITFLT